MDWTPSRIALLDRATHRIRSVRRPQGVVLEELGLTEMDTEEVQQWFSCQSVEEDNSYLAFFYRCLEENSEFYYVYQESGWRCGGITLDTPILGRLVPYAEAKAAVEDWYEDLKWIQAKGG
jgi:hypothetical protein